VFWDARKIEFACIVEGCPAPATVIVISDTGEEHGPHCGPHADERINTENEPLYKALRESEAERIAEEKRLADEGVTA